MSEDWPKIYAWYQDQPEWVREGVLEYYQAAVYVLSHKLQEEKEKRSILYVHRDPELSLLSSLLIAHFKQMEKLMPRGAAKTWIVDHELEVWKPQPHGKPSIL